MPERVHQVKRMDVVAHLLAAISEHDVRSIGNRTFYEVSEKAVQLRPRMVGTSETTATKAGSLHTEIAPVFLDEDIGGDLRGAEQAVHCLVDAHRFVNSMPPVGVVVQ